MANGAVLIFRISQRVAARCQVNPISLPAKITSAVVAFQAERKHLRPIQQPCIHPAMRHMARRAAIHSDSGMLKHKRPTLIHVTLQARFFILQAVRHHPRPGAHPRRRRIPTMRIVAIAALHKAFVYAVFHRHRKLGLNIGVAAITKIGLRLGK